MKYDMVQMVNLLGLRLLQFDQARRLGPILIEERFVKYFLIE
jgi:hypothetical protein